MTSARLPHSLASSPSRRRALRNLVALSLAPTLAGTGWAARPPGSLRVVQLSDNSVGQQDVSRDYAIGFRLAWADTAKPAVALSSITVDSGAAAQDQLRTLRDDPSVVALAGTVGEQLALDCITSCQASGTSLAHIAPWMADTRYDNVPQVVPLFASRDQQISNVLNNLRQVGHSSFGVVYASRAQQSQLEAPMQRLANTLKLPLRSYAPATPFDMAGLVASLGPDTPAILLVLCSTVDLANLKRALDDRKMVRSLVSLADTNPTVLKQLDVLRGPSSIIVTQVVADATYDMQPVTRRYRTLLARLFDEPPTPMSLAGFLAGSYTLELINRIDGPLTRTSVLDAAKSRPLVNLGGLVIDHRTHARGTSFLSETRLSADGKLRG